MEKGNSSQIVKLMREAFEQNVVFIINANDAIDGEELKALEICADNDKLFGLISEEIPTEIAIIVFSEKGFRDDKNNLINTVNIRELDKIISYAKGGSKQGHGNNGMETKIRILCNLAKQKNEAILVSVLEENYLLRAVRGEDKFGTRFVG